MFEDLGFTWWSGSTCNPLARLPAPRAAGVILFCHGNAEAAATAATGDCRVSSSEEGSCDGDPGCETSGWGRYWTCLDSERGFMELFLSVCGPWRSLASLRVKRNADVDMFRFERRARRLIDGSFMMI